MIRTRFKYFMPERNEFSTTGEETLLSVSEYYGVKPRSEAFDEDTAEGRAVSLEGYRKVTSGDFVMNYMLAWKGAYGVAEHDGIVSPAYAVYKIDSAYADQRFIHHRLRSEHMRSVFRARSKGIIESRLRLYPDAFLSLELELPDLDTQKSIADFLDRETTRIDHLIDKKKWLVRLFQEKLAAIIHNAVNNAPSFEVQPLHRFCKIVTGKTPSRADESNFNLDDGLLWATPTNLGSFEPINSTREKLTEEGEKGQVVVPARTVLVNGIGASIGKVGFTGQRMTFNQQIHGIVQIQRRLIDRFLFFIMITKKDEIVSLASNTTIPIINADRFGRIPVPLPMDDVQADVVEKIEFHIKKTNQLIDAITQSINRLTELRAALITAAVTGQIDVATWGKQGQIDRRLDQIESDTTREAARA